VLAGRHDREALGGRLDVEAHRDDVILALLREGIARRAEGRQHPAVGGQHLRHEARHAPFPRGRREMLQQVREGQ
jgi:ferric-dicitrate binding protein FerR (iron transport regulator)